MRPTPQQVLACPMRDNDIHAETIHEYLVTLLAVVWVKQDEFSGKRPFGNSGWAYDLYGSLIAEGLVEGELDEWDCVEDGDIAFANTLVLEAIRSLLPSPQ